MRVLFIDPMGDKESSGINIGIAYCATALLNKGHVVSILDLVNIRTVETDKKIKNAIEVFRPDAVGLSVTNMSFNNVRLYVDLMRAYFSGNIILGGPEITAVGGEALKLIPGSDMAVIGEGENTLTELLNAIERKAPLNTVPGLCWKDSNGINVNKRREYIQNLDMLDFPRYDMFGIDKMDVYPIVTSRGCPYGCSFCFSNLGKKWRARSPENILEEIKIAKYSYGAKLFHICDASFNVDVNRMEQFCRLLITEKIDLPWVIQGFRADKVTEETISLLSEAKCGRIWVGIETLEEDVFAKINKGESIKQIKTGIELMKKYKIEIFGYMLMGLPGDTFKKTLRSFENARKFNLDLLAYASCVPFTGTRIERWVKNNAMPLMSSYDISSIGSDYEKIAFETSDFTKRERIKARKILNIRSGSYDEP